MGSLLALDDGTLISGGSKDRLVKTWDSTKDFQPIAEVTAHYSH